MRSISPSRSSSYGFTLTELLVIAPVVILVLAGFIALLINLTGQALVAGTKAQLAYEANNIFKQIELDTNRTVEFRDVSFPTISPQGPADSGSPASFNLCWFCGATYSTAYILRTNATDKNPLDPTRQIVYTDNGSGGCTTTPYQVDIVYYRKYVNGEWRELWRRVIPDRATTPCMPIWQKSSCAPGLTGVPCETEDQLISDELGGGMGTSVWYYNTPNRSTTNVTPGYQAFFDWIDTPYVPAGSTCYAGDTAVPPNPPVEPYLYSLPPPEYVPQDSHICLYNFLNPYQTFTEPFVGDRSSPNALQMSVAVNVEKVVAGKTVTHSVQSYFTRGLSK